MATVRRRARVLVPLAFSLVAIACSSSHEGESGRACPAGTTRREWIDEVAGPPADSRAEAVRVELEDLGMGASDDAIAAALIAAGPGTSAGTEETDVESSEGIVVTMSLEPMDPGWSVGRSSWCAPG